jgi:hypothetical protein
MVCSCVSTRPAPRFQSQEITENSTTEHCPSELVRKLDSDVRPDAWSRCCRPPISTVHHSPSQRFSDLCGTDGTAAGRLSISYPQGPQCFASTATFLSARADRSHFPEKEPIPTPSSKHRHQSSSISLNSLLMLYISAPLPCTSLGWRAPTEASTKVWRMARRTVTCRQHSQVIPSSVKDGTVQVSFHLVPILLCWNGRER